MTNTRSKSAACACSKALSRASRARQAAASGERGEDHHLVEVANADATRLEITGVPFTDLPPGRGLSAVWVWDPAKKTYKGSARDITVPAKKKTAPDSR